MPNFEGQTNKIHRSTTGGFFLIGMLTLFHPCANLASAVHPDTAEDARSYIQLLNDKGDAISRFDVAARRETLMLLPDGNLIEVSILERTLYDEIAHRYLHAASVTQNLQLAKRTLQLDEAKPADDVDTSMRTSYHAQLISKKDFYSYDGTQVRTWKHDDPLKQFFGPEPDKAIDYRKLAINGSGYALADFLKLLSSATNGSVSDTKTGISVQLTVPYFTPDSDQQTGRLEWKLTRDTMTVESFKDVDNIFWKGKVYPALQQRSRFRWKTIDANQLIVSATIENRIYTSFGPENLTGEAEPIFAPTHIDCQWLSANTELPDKPFTRKFISDLDELRKFIDPRLNNAVDLVAPSTSPEAP